MFLLSQSSQAFHNIRPPLTTLLLLGLSSLFLISQPLLLLQCFNSMEYGAQVPEYFLCPISLEVMKDPVTAITGITYERKNIEQWLAQGRNKTCPVTKQELPHDSELIPNHTLKRLIQSWSSSGPNPIHGRRQNQELVDKSQVMRLLRGLSLPERRLDCLKKIHELSLMSESSRKCIEDAGAAKTMLPLAVEWMKECRVELVEQVLSIFQVIHLVCEDLDVQNNDIGSTIIDPITSVIQGRSRSSTGYSTAHATENAILLLKRIFEFPTMKVVMLKQDFFDCMIWVLRRRSSLKSIKACLQILLSTSQWGWNQTRIVQAGAVSELVELELSHPDKRTTELAFSVLEQLCRSPSGRSKFLGHPAGIAVVAKRTLRVSALADEMAVQIFSYICNSSPTEEVVQEMLSVGAVTKLCMVIQANCETKVKKKARNILRLHSNVWNDSPCVALYLITRYY